MWTNVVITCKVTLGEVSWYASALWRDDPEVEPVQLVKSGIARVHPLDGPAAVLASVVREIDWEHAELRDGTVGP